MVVQQTADCRQERAVSAAAEELTNETGRQRDCNAKGVFRCLSYRSEAQIVLFSTLCCNQVSAIAIHPRP